MNFGVGWKSVIIKAGNQSLKYVGRRELGVITDVVCGYYGSAAVVLVTNSAKVITIAKCCSMLWSSGYS